MQAIACATVLIPISLVPVLSLQGTGAFAYAVAAVAINAETLAIAARRTLDGPRWRCACNLRLLHARYHCGGRRPAGFGAGAGGSPIAARIT